MAERDHYEPEHDGPRGRQLERRALLLRDRDIPGLLRRALDRVPEAWSVLWVQAELVRAATTGENDPQKIREALAKISPRGSIAQKLRLRASLLEGHLRYIESLGLSFNFDKNLLELPSTGGARPSVYRSLIEALDVELRKERPRPTRAEQLRTMGALLEPYFEPSRTSTDDLRDGKLARTYDNV